MQRLAWEVRRSAGHGCGPARGATTIDRVADQRMAALGEMDADLVRAPGQQPAFDQRRRVGKGALDLVAGYRRLAALGYRGFLIGEMLMRASDPAAKLRELIEACVDRTDGGLLTGATRP